MRFTSSSALKHISPNAKSSRQLWNNMEEQCSNHKSAPRSGQHCWELTMEFLQSSWIKMVTNLKSFLNPMRIWYVPQSYNSSYYNYGNEAVQTKT